MRNNLIKAARLGPLQESSATGAGKLGGVEKRRAGVARGVGGGYLGHLALCGPQQLARLCHLWANLFYTCNHWGGGCSETPVMVSGVAK